MEGTRPLAACLYEVYLPGMSFYVLADHFLVHQSHPYKEETRNLRYPFFSRSQQLLILGLVSAQELPKDIPGLQGGSLPPVRSQASPNRSRTMTSRHPVICCLLGT
ncbi:hypothetical protein EV702DRAFT_493031 [Suillus placidus]|uniref:Uncharacterized protein n=1 Tax=Suillus placidus TaxID=48579 RepID=A0A9P7A551_9AGAM|nr:hypothetical protein EV702DRAFT_493031 [Suillus placidus]